MNSIARKLRRISQMGPSELGCRLAQAARRRVERIRPGGRLRRVGDAELRDAFALEGFRKLPVSDAANKLLEHLRSRERPKFFSGVDMTPEEAANLGSSIDDGAVARADRIIRGDFALLGYEALQLADPAGGLRWNYDPTTGVEAPRTYWTGINFLDPQVVGDVKVVWELSRFQFVFDLGKAFALTGDDRYAQTYFELFEDWHLKNPPGTGMNWCSGLELAFRAISWVWGHYLFLDADSYSPRIAWELLRSLVIHARRIEAYLAYFTAPNTHLLGEALGLFYVGLFLPELPEAEKWKRLGTKILVAESEKQIRPDGGHFEQSAYYHRYALDFYQQFIILCDLNGLDLPGDFRDRIEKMAEFALYAMLPDGRLPMIGDADGGKALQLERCDPNDARPALSTAAVLFGRGDFKLGAGGLREETLYLLGTRGAEALAAIEDAPPGKTSVHRPDAGWFFLRSGWGPYANYLYFDCGPQGMGPGGHGHADMLGIEVAAFGRPIIIDPGTYIYTVSEQWRDHFRGTRAHNTIAVDDLDQAVPTKPFKWENLPRYEVLTAHIGDTLDFIDARHYGYERLEDPVVHRRRVLFIKPEYWLIVDTLEAAGEHEYEISFNLAPSNATLHPDTLAVVTEDPDQPNCSIVPARTELLEGEIKTGSEDPIRGWTSYDYGARVPSPTVCYRLHAAGCRQVSFVIYPHAAGHSIPVRARPLEIDTAGGGVAIEVTIGDRSDFIALSGRPDGRLSFNDVCVRAEAAWIRTGADGAPSEFRIVNGTGILWQGHDLLAADALRSEFSKQLGT